MKYTIYQDRGFYDEFLDLNVTLGLVNGFLCSQNEPTTFTVENENKEIVASFSNRQIIGRFNCQTESKTRRDWLETVETREFDATTYILSLPYNDFVGISDRSSSSDDVGRKFVDWKGPFDVEIEESINEYFGVDDIGEITPQHFDFVKRKVAATDAIEDEVILTIKLNIRRESNLDVEISDIVNDIDYEFKSNTVGARVVDSQIESCEPIRRMKM